MHLALAKVVTGLVVGTLVGFTGIGAGVVLLPLLIFGFRVPAMIAVGTDAVFNCVTKLGSGYLHYRQGTVNRSLVAALLTGSVPGAITGVALLAFLRAHYGGGVNEFLKVLTGLLLIAIPSLLCSKANRREAMAGCSQNPASVPPRSSSGYWLVSW